ncbi:sensor histidine kinase [Anaerosporobacter faecicola]|uniref:sensor histidine kinase n=1 Tax=Anaerosporobacter faecicola TaxID=2718714 RepID=UPI002ED046D6
MKNRTLRITLQTKLLVSFIATTIIILLVNVYMYYNINKMIQRLDMVYQSNVNLNELTESLQEVQANMTDYLNTKTSHAMEEYFRAEQEYSNKIEKLNNATTNNPLKQMEKNIRNISNNYLDSTNQAIEAKRGRIVEKYKVWYERATELYEYIRTYIYSLNNEQFTKNVVNYKNMSMSLRYTEYVSVSVLLLIAVCNIVIITIITKGITNPIRRLAETANQIALGNLDHQLVEVKTHDEIAVVGKAFNKMVRSLNIYITQLKDSMEKEREMKERELMMEAHLKDAQLRYLQAQINPHFLFNTLNAGAQLAMMEEADRTYAYIQNVAEFFRYNVKKDKECVSILEELELVDNYIYILNVRFSGEIHYEKDIQEDMKERLSNIQIPSMVLQPIVENSITYGIREISWKGFIHLSVYKKAEYLCISIKDNGVGMSQTKINAIFDNQLRESDVGKDSNGVGLNNVISRLRLFFHDEEVLKIQSDGENKGTEVIIRVPNM